MMHKTKLFSLAGLALAVVLLLGVNITGNMLFKSIRVDLTQNKLYTLSEGSRNTIQGLEEPITLRLFLSRELATRLPGINTYAIRVQELLEEFERDARGKIRLRVIEPQPFSEQEDRAVSYGLEGVPLGDGDSIFYFGLVATGATDEEEIIPFFSNAREDFLEYDITRLIYQVSGSTHSVVGLLSTLTMDGAPPAGGQLTGGLPRPWIMVDQIEQFFEIRSLQSDVSVIPSEIDVLMVVHPSSLEEAALYAIDQFVLAGGRVVMFADPWAEGDQTSMMSGGGVDGYVFDALLAAWGVKLRPNAVAADISLANRVRAQVNNRNVVVDYPVWMSVGPAVYDRLDVVTAELGEMLIPTAGVLDFLGTEGVTVSPLVQTTSNAGVIDPVRLGPGSSPASLVEHYQPGGEVLTIASRITGNVKSAYPGGIDKDDAPGAAEHLAESESPINVIVVADTDLLRDRFWVSTQRLLGSQLLIPTAANNTLVINSLENLSGDDDLISIRSRGGHARPFTLLDDVRREAEMQFRQKEQQLMAELDNTELRLVELQQQKSTDDALILSDEQGRELDRFLQQKVNIRKDLRDVRHDLREDIENIESWIRFVNIGLMPLIVGMGGLFFGASRVSRRKA